MKQKTIAIFSAYIYPHLGGIEIFLVNLIKYLKSEYKIIIVTSNYNFDKSFEIKDEITIIRLPVFRIFKDRYPIFKINKQYKSLINKLDDFNINVIIVNTRFHLTSHIGANYGRKKNIPVWLIEHGSAYITLGNEFIDFFANAYENFLTLLIKPKITSFYGVSKKCNGWLKKLGINANGIFYNAIDKEVYYKNKQYITDNSNKIVVSFAGRLIKEKGIIILLEAFKRLNNPDIILYVAGDGPLLKNLLKSYKNNNIMFLGRLSHEDTIRLFARTDIFINPSYYPEGGPITIFEAGIMKCAVITTIVISDKYGLIVKTSVKDLVEKMDYLINNRHIISLMKDNLHKIVMQQFTWDKTAETIKSELQKIIK